MKYFLLSLFFIAFSLTAHAQTSDSDSLDFRYKVGLSGDYAYGNMNRFILLSRGKCSFLSDSLPLKIGAHYSYRYSTSGSTMTSNDLILMADAYLFPQSRFQPYTLLWVEKSFRRKIDLRRQILLGLAWMAVNTPEHYVNFAAKISYESTRFESENYEERPADANGNTVNALRFGLRLHGHHQLFIKKLQFSYDSWAQPSLTGKGNFRMHTDLALDYHFSRHLAFHQGLDFSYESLVLKGVKTADFLMTFGLTYGNF